MHVWKLTIVSRLVQVNVSDLGLVTQSGKVIWGKYAQVSAQSHPQALLLPASTHPRVRSFAQVTNNPENDGCINALLLVSLSCDQIIAAWRSRSCCVCLLVRCKRTVSWCGRLCSGNYCISTLFSTGTLNATRFGGSGRKRANDEAEAEPLRDMRAQRTKPTLCGGD